MLNNLIFLSEEDLNKSVYRIFSFERLEEIFLEKKLTLVKPKLWDDPFENFILKAEGKLEDGTPFNIGFRDNYYGQCWSLTKESDAMWRIYSQNKDGVKVKTTLRKLFAPLYQIGDEYTRTNGERYKFISFLGKVKYSSTKKLTLMLKDKERMGGKIFDQSGWGQASSFYYKRLAFKHENEVRIIFNDPSNSFDIFKFSISPIDLFDEIVLDPRMSESTVSTIKTKLLEWNYYKKVFQSGLYKIPKLRITLPI